MVLLKLSLNLSLNPSINLLYRYGTVPTDYMVKGDTVIVSISYIGMVQQHLVVGYIITPRCCLVKCGCVEKR